MQIFSPRPSAESYPAFIDTWRQKSPDFERYLLKNGWKKQWNERQPIDEIYNNPNNAQSVGVVYTKDLGKVGCSIDIMYNADQSQGQTYFSGECARRVAFFGGYN